MVETLKHQSMSSSRWWWMDGPTSIQRKRSSWLQSAISELDEKTKAMLKLIEEDADSFAQRAEMYYKKRPELISMVEDFYRTHRSLAERCDQLKSESRHMTPRASSLVSLSKCQSDKLMIGLQSSLNDYDSCSEIYGLDYSGESDVDDVDEPVEGEIDECGKSDVDDPEPEFEDDVASKEEKVELVRLRGEMERLKEENMMQKEQLMQKDEEKREVIRHLSIAMDLMREENVNLKKKLAATKNSAPKRQNGRGIEMNKLKNAIWGKIFN